MATLEDLKTLFGNREPHDIAIEISGFTGFRTTLMEELTPAEIDKLYQIHSGHYKPNTPPTAFVFENERSGKEEKRKWVSYILKIATDEGIHRPVMVMKNRQNVVDEWYNLNKWMLTQSTAKKLLYFCNLEELKAVYQQLCKLRDNNEKSAKKPLNKAWWSKGIRNEKLN